jgi:hypothetical protein
MALIHDNEEASFHWHLMQVPVLSMAVMLTTLTVLGKVIAPVRDSYQLGYDAGLRDGLRAALDIRPSERVIHLDSRPSRRRTDVPTG